MGFLGLLGSTLAKGARSMFDPAGMAPGADTGVGATAGRVAKSMFDPMAQKGAPPMVGGGGGAPGVQPGGMMQPYQPPVTTQPVGPSRLPGPSSVADGEASNALPYRSGGAPTAAPGVAGVAPPSAPRRRLGVLDDLAQHPGMMGGGGGMGGAY